MNNQVVKRRRAQRSAGGRFVPVRDEETGKLLGEYDPVQDIFRVKRGGRFYRANLGKYGRNLKKSRRNRQNQDNDIDTE